eukprot:2208793-Amphidinium_carterae.1
MLFRVGFDNIVVQQMPGFRGCSASHAKRAIFSSTATSKLKHGRSMEVPVAGRDVSRCASGLICSAHDLRCCATNCIIAKRQCHPRGVWECAQTTRTASIANHACVWECQLLYSPRTVCSGRSISHATLSLCIASGMRRMIKLQIEESSKSGAETKLNNTLYNCASFWHGSPPQVGQRPAPKARPPPTNSGWSLFSACMSSKGVGVDEEVNFDAAKPMTSKAVLIYQEKKDEPLKDVLLLWAMAVLLRPRRQAKRRRYKRALKPRKWCFTLLASWCICTEVVACAEQWTP